MTRLEQSLITTQIQALREELKTTESSRIDPIPIMKKIEELQTRKNWSQYTKTKQSKYQA